MLTLTFLPFDRKYIKETRSYKYLQIASINHMFPHTGGSFNNKPELRCEFWSTS